MAKNNKKSQKNAGKGDADRKMMPSNFLLDECCCNGKSRFGYAFFATVLVLVCALAEHYYNKYNYKKLSESSKLEAQHAIEKNCNDQNIHLEQLEKKIESLQKEVSSLSMMKQQSAHSELVSCKADSRKKWKIWMALLDKLQKNESFQAELERFNKAFSEDTEILEMVKSLTVDAVDLTSNSKSSECDVVGACKQYLNKIVTVKKINHRKLYEISGYILSSIKIDRNINI